MGDLDIKRNPAPVSQTVAQPPVEQAVKSKPVKPKRSLFKKTNIIAAIAVILVIFSGIVTYKYIQANNQIKQLKNHPQQVVNNSTAKLLANVGKIAVLPTNESPTVALVKNSSKLTNQPFFTHAQDGDYVIVYSQSKVAILYRPSTNQIVEDAGTTN
jgi:hypothetical protein